MVHQIHTSEKPADPRRAIAVSVAVFLTSLAAAWGVQQLATAGQAVVLGRPMTPAGSPFSIRLPEDWEPNPAEGLPGKVFAFRRRIKGQLAGSVFLLTEQRVQSAPDFAAECLIQIIGTQGRLFTQQEEVAFGSDLRGVQMVANLGPSSVACRTARGPKGNFYALIAILGRPLLQGAGELLDQMGETIQWSDLRFTRDMGSVTEAVGLRFDAPSGTKFVLDLDPPIPHVDLFADEATAQGWHMSIHQTFLAPSRRIIDMAYDQRIDLGWDDQEPKLLELNDGRQAAFISQKTRTGYHAFWTVQLGADRAAVLQFSAAEDFADRADPICRSVAESLEMKTDVLGLNIEAALSAGRAVMDQIYDRGLVAWWPEESQTLWYIHWEHGRPTRWIEQKREAVIGNRPISYRVEQNYFGANAMARPKPLLHLEWNVDPIGMDLDEPPEEDEQYVTLPAFDLATYLLTQQEDPQQAIIRVSLSRAPSRRFFEMCKPMPPQPSAEFPGQTEYRVLTSRDYLPHPNILVFDEQGTLIREEIGHVTIRQSSEVQIKKLFFQRNMVRLQIKDGES